MGDLLPYVRQVLASTNPRILSSLKVADLVERLGPVLEGKEDLTTALTHIKNDANFRVIGELPVAPLLKAVGIHLDEKEHNIVPGLAAAEDKDNLDLA
jgi:hypothetical protein